MLKDGRTVTIRPIRSDDGERLRASHERLSPESQYRRFMSSKPQLTPTDARYLVEIDGHDHFALVATVPDGDGEAIVAVARYIRMGAGSPSAEFAIVVGDDYQRQGLARELMSRLAVAARRRGVRRFHATSFTDNLGLTRLASRVAPGDTWRRIDGSVAELEFDLVSPAFPPAPRRVTGQTPERKAA